MLPMADIARNYSVPLGFVRIHALFLGTCLLQIINTAVRHNHAGYWAYILLLEGPFMLINLCAIYGFQKLWMHVKLGFDGASYQATLWSFGSLTMPPTENISQDVRLAAAVPLASAALSLLWLLIYGLFDRFEFDETFTDGVDKAELDSFGGILANVAAQSFWRCLPLVLIHLFLPAYPMSSSALLVGGLVSNTKMSHRKVGYVTDVTGTVMATCVLLSGLYETIWDDDNGCGIWYLFNAAALLAFTVPRLFAKGSDQEHPLMGRPCYHETEETKEQDHTVKEPNEGNSTERFPSEPTNIV